MAGRQSVSHDISKIVTLPIFVFLSSCVIGLGVSHFTPKIKGTVKKEFYYPSTNGNNSRYNVSIQTESGRMVDLYVLDGEQNKESLDSSVNRGTVVEFPVDNKLSREYSLRSEDIKVISK